MILATINSKLLLSLLKEDTFKPFSPFPIKCKSVTRFTDGRISAQLNNSVP